MRRVHRHRQAGAVLLTTCLVLLFLLGFVGFALDFGRAFVVKTELQSAVDSCALSAAQELDGAIDAMTRATSAGLTAGNLNRVHFQDATWAGKGQITSADFTFRDSNYVVTTDAVRARYVECAHTQPTFQLWLVRAMAAFSGNTTDFPEALDIGARAVATRASAQTACPVPLGLKPKTGGTGPNYGFTVGDWVTLLMAPGGATNGHIGWYNLDGSTSASETEFEMNGYCGTAVGDQLGTPGVQTSIADAWNYRFGIYKNTGDPSISYERPDYTGYAYTTKNWPSRFRAYDGPVPAGADPTAANFENKRIAYASCADTGTQVHGGGSSCEGITGLTLNGFTKLAVPGMVMGGHREFGKNRRIVLVPIVNDANRVTDWSCMLMLQPLSVPMTEVDLEFLGNAGDIGSPCTTGGLPGGTAGPLVPVLVR